VIPRRRPAAAAVVLVLSSCYALSGCSGSDGAQPGASGVGDPYFPDLGNGGYDARHYSLALAYAADTGRLTGTAEMTARATAHLSAFNLDLAGLAVASATVDGAPAVVSRAGTELTLRPRHHLARGRTFRTVVRYSGVPRRIIDPDGSAEGWLASDDHRRVEALGEPSGSMTWFPSDNHPSDKATYDIRVTVPSALKAVSNGELRSTSDTEPGVTTYAWHTAEPMASYLATVVIGPYETHASPETRQPGGSATSHSGHGPAVFTAVDPTVAPAGRRLLTALPAVMSWEEETFGPFPFSSTGLIIGRPADAAYALETQNRPFLPGPTDVVTLVHELAHQWYGDSVTPATWRDMWLNEGFATYAEWLWQDHQKGQGHVPIARSFAAAYDDPAEWAFPPGRPRSAADLSQPPVYGRGAMVLQRVRREVGDATFFRILRGWPAAHRHGNASTADFTAYAELLSGRDLSRVWQDWLYGDRKPHL
jgi:aminopeptidase N